MARSIKALEKDLETLGEMLNMNYGLLCAIGVSNDKLDKLIYAAREVGALGAKLTGAEGGGCMIALATGDKLSGVAEAIEKASERAFITRKTLDGVRIEK